MLHCSAGIIDKGKELGLHEFEEKQKAAIGQVGGCLFACCLSSFVAASPGSCGRTETQTQKAAIGQVWGAAA